MTEKLQELKSDSAHRDPSQQVVGVWLCVRVCACACALHVHAYVYVYVCVRARARSKFFIVSADVLCMCQGLLVSETSPSEM